MIKKIGKIETFKQFKQVINYYIDMNIDIEFKSYSFDEEFNIGITKDRKVILVSEINNYNELNLEDYFTIENKEDFIELMSFEEFRSLDEENDIKIEDIYGESINMEIDTLEDKQIIYLVN